MHANNIVLLPGRAIPELSQAIADEIGCELANLTNKTFSDGEIFVEISTNVRGKDVYILQSTCSPANNHIMELLIIADALRRASAESITAVIPYFGYARQDRKTAGRTPISAKLVADLIEAAFVNRVVTVDVHAGQIQGFFSIPMDHLYAAPVLLKRINEVVAASGADPVVVSPDAGGVERARAFAKQLDCGLAIIDKRRPEPNKSEVMHIIGDVSGKTAVLVDDMIDTAGTITSAAKALVDNGAKGVIAAATHAVLSGPAIERLSGSVLDEIIVTDTIPLSPAARACDKIFVTSVAGLLGEAIKRIQERTSVSSLFEYKYQVTK